MKTKLIIYVILSLISTALAGDYSGGNGTTLDPYLIGTPADLLALGTQLEDYNDCFKLIADIDLSGISPPPYPCHHRPGHRS